MGLPSGRKWAVANIDLSSPSGFQEVGGVVSPFKYECSFCSWGNTDMYNPNDQNSFVDVYDWGGVNAQEPFYEGQPYGSTPGAALNADFGPSFDAARRHLGAPWRMPRTNDQKELIDNCDFIDENGNVIATTDKRILMNGVTGIRLRSKINGKVIFFPATGDGIGTAWNGRGGNGLYWTKDWLSNKDARCMFFGSSGVNPQYAYGRCGGFAVRAVF